MQKKTPISSVLKKKVYTAANNYSYKRKRRAEPKGAQIINKTQVFTRTISNYSKSPGNNCASKINKIRDQNLVFN